MSLGSFAASAENTAAGIAQTVTAGLTPFINDLTTAVVSSNSFDLRKLREEAMTIYVVVKPTDLETVAPVVRLFFQQVVDLNNDEFGKNPKHRHLVLLGMDEFVTIGRVPAIQKGIPYIRSTGLRLLALFQSGAQLSSEYTPDGAKAFSDNFGCAIFYTPAPQDVSGAEHLSKVLGNQTVKAKSQSKRGTWGWDDNSKSETESEQRRPLMLPQEILRMPVDQAIVVMSGMHPIQVRKPFAAKDRRFTERYVAPPEVPLIQVRPNAAPVAAPATRPVAAEDLMGLDALELSEFSLDFSDIVLPKEPVTEAEIEDLCSKVYGRVMMPAGASAEIQ
jgi:type IV secretion system protein VirD4